MTKFTIITATVGALGAGALGLAGMANAAAVTPYGNTAAATIQNLQAQGYNVQINGSAAVPLSRCAVTGVEGLGSGQPDPTRSNTVYVDIDCPDNV